MYTCSCWTLLNFRECQAIDQILIYLCFHYFYVLIKAHGTKVLMPLPISLPPSPLKICCMMSTILDFITFVFCPLPSRATSFNLPVQRILPPMSVFHRQFLHLSLYQLEFITARFKIDYENVLIQLLQIQNTRLLSSYLTNSLPVYKIISSRFSSFEGAVVIVQLCSDLCLRDI